MAMVAQSQVQDDVHPLLRHPRPIKRDSAKAQRMLGLIADDDEKAKSLQREKSVTTRWLERPLYERLEASAMDLEKEGAAKELRIDSIHEETAEEDDADLLDRWTKPDRSSSLHSEASMCAEPKPRTDLPFMKKHAHSSDCPQPTSYNAQHLLSPEWTASPPAMSPKMQRPRPTSLQPNSPGIRQESFSSQSSVASSPRMVHPQTWAAPPTQYRGNPRGERPVSFQPQSFTSMGSPKANESRPRPTSFATYSHQRNRSNGKIASSRGLRNNSYPNFSRPNPDIAPRTVPGEHMENDIIHQRPGDRRAAPPLASSRIQNALSGFELSADKEKTEKKAKNRWSTIPLTLKLFARRRSSAASQEPPKLDARLDDFQRMNLTETQLPSYPNKGHDVPTTSKARYSVNNLLPTPPFSPLHNQTTLAASVLPLPFAPWADGEPSPTVSLDRRRGSATSSLSATRKTPPSRLSVESVPQVRPTSMHSHRSSVFVSSPTTTTAPPPLHRYSTMDMSSSSPRPSPSRRGTPTLERTCMLCKTTKPPSAFSNRRITNNCWHEPATCVACLQAWIESCLVTQGLNHCTCPECGENMAFEDVGAFANNDPRSMSK